MQYQLPKTVLCPDLQSLHWARREAKRAKELVEIEFGEAFAETVNEIKLLETLHPEDDILTIRQFGRAFGSVSGFRNPPVAARWRNKLDEIMK